MNTSDQSSMRSRGRKRSFFLFESSRKGYEVERISCDSIKVPDRRSESNEKKVGITLGNRRGYCALKTVNEAHSESSLNSNQLLFSHTLSSIVLFAIRQCRKFESFRELDDASVSIASTPDSRIKWIVPLQTIVANSLCDLYSISRKFGFYFSNTK